MNPIKTYGLTFAAWKRRVTVYAGLAVVAMLLLGFLVSFLKAIFYGLALVCAGYLVWVLTRKEPNTPGRGDSSLEGPGPLLHPKPHANAQDRLDKIEKQRNA